jgi:uncharacterized protein (TIGR03083 family)
MIGPESIPQSVRAWDQVLEALITIGDRLTDAQWATRTECPEWSVKDVYAHIAGIEEWYADGRPTLPNTDALTDAPVRARRHLDGPGVLATLRSARDRRHAYFAAHPVGPDDTENFIFTGPLPMWLLLSFRAMDVWHHEQDIRRAVGQPGDLDTEAAEITGMQSRAGLPGVADRAGAPAGSLIRITVTGPVVFDAWILAGTDGGTSEVTPDSLPAGTTPTVSLTLGSEDFGRLVAGRISPTAAAIQVTGDRALAANVLANLTMTP